MPLLSARLRDVLDEYVNTLRGLHKIVSIDWPSVEPEYPPTLNQTLRYFLDVMMMRARAAYVLLLNDAYWDSEIVLRSLYEAFARCLTFATSSSPAELLEEFWTNQLVDQDRRTGHQSGRAAVMFPPGDPGRSVMALLADENFIRQSPRNKKQRRALEQKWSFAELIEALSKGSGGPLYTNADSLLHMYGMQSAVTHVSSKFYDLLWDRALRDEEREVLENGHYCRQMSDAVWLTSAALDASLRALNIPRERAEAPLGLAAQFSEVTKPHTDAFNASQAAFYERYGYPYSA